MKYQITIVLSAVFNAQGQLLISKRNDPEFIGASDKWDLVGGLVDFGELPEKTIIREIKEETGLDVIIDALLPKILVNVWDKTNGDQQHTNIICYRCKVVGGELQMQTDEPKLLDMKFINPKELINYDLLPTVQEVVDMAMKVKVSV